MKLIFRILFLFIACIFISSCSIFIGKPKPIVVPDFYFNDPDTADFSEIISTIGQNDSLQTEVINRPVQKYQPSTPVFAKIVHTELDLKVNIDKENISGSAYLYITPNNRKLKNVEFDAKGFLLKNVESFSDTGVFPLSFQYDSLKLAVNLGKTLNPGDTTVIRVTYEAIPGTLYDRGIINNPLKQGLFFESCHYTNTLSHQVWTVNETESASTWFPTIDAPNQRFSADIFITVPYGYTAISNGELIYSTLNHKDDSTITFLWKQHKPVPPYVISLSAGKFSKTQTAFKGFSVEYFVPNEYGNEVNSILGKTPDMLTFFSEKFGVSYPWEKYAQVVVHDYFAAGMENIGLTFLNDTLFENKEFDADKINERLLVHELAHQWFGSLVTCEAWSQLALNEGFAAFAELLWSEYAYGNDEAFFLTDSYAELYKNEADNINEPVIRFYYNDVDDDLFNFHTSYKGALILATLRNYLGDELFFKSTCNYLSDNYLKSVELDNLRMAFEEICGEDLNWFFDQWFLNSDDPRLEVHYTYDAEQKRIALQVRQLQDYAFRLPLKIVYGNKFHQEYENILLHTRDTVFQISSTDVPDYLYIDKAQIPLTDVSYINQADWTLAYTAANDIQTKFEILRQVESFASDSLAGSVFLTAINDTNFYVLTKALYDVNGMINGFTLEQKNQVVSRVRNLISETKNPGLKSLAIKTLSLTKSGNIDVFENAAKDTSINVIAASLEALFESDTAVALQVCHGFDASKNKNIILIISDLYSCYGDLSCTEFFQNAILKFQNPLFEKLSGNYFRFCITKGNVPLNSFTDFMIQYTVGHQSPLILKSVSGYFYNIVNAENPDDKVLQKIKNWLDKNSH